MHGYAITGHSAQGLTCDKAFVLLSSEASREWCCTALSRGRVTNRLYAVAPDAGKRAEYAPDTDPPADARDALAGALGRSTAQTLASDAVEQGSNDRELARVLAERDAAERAYARAVRTRVDLERRPPHRMALRARAGHQERVGEARAAEVAAERKVEVLRSREAELRERVSHERARTLREARAERRMARPTIERGIDLGR
jgi:hypothetical protein